jgi:HPt (histidine-containing phosphotransfer) domain-containing protein
LDKTGSHPTGPYVVQADPLLRPLIPDYLRNRRDDVQRLVDLLAQQDFTALRRLGHNMSGSGAAYGLPPISALGKGIEDAALASDAGRIGALAASLREFLDTVQLPP